MSVRTVPEPYLLLEDEALEARIRAAKEALGGRLVILGHHYQRDDVIAHADITGDSLKLARLGAERADAEFLVFCGVHFMAESADVLRGPRQTVILPDLAAGCSMADMAPTEDVLLAGATLLAGFAGRASSWRRLGAARFALRVHRCPPVQG